VADVFAPPLEEAVEEDVADLLGTVTATPYRYAANVDPETLAPPVANALQASDRRREALIRAFGNLPEESQQAGVEVYDASGGTGQRPAFAALTPQREMAATMLACGATNEEAARYAGVTGVTVGKWGTEEVFRKRIEELQSVVMRSISGSVLTELQRRTQGKHLRKMEINDLLRIFDRVAGSRAPGAAARAAAVTVNVGVSTYENVLQRVIAADAQSGGTDDGEAESGDFPVYGAGLVPLPGGGSLRTGEVPPAGLRETSG
jgi:hypothetical protein